MAVRSRRIFTAESIGVGPTIVYTVPSGRTALFRGVQTYNQNTTTAVGVRYLINGTAAGQRVSEFAVNPLSVGPFIFLILNPGDILRVELASGTGPVNVSGYGSLLLGEPQ